jgi:hypothetical protein
VIDQVVHGDSAIIDYSRETRGTIHADHFGMTKFSTRDDPGYGKVLYAIEMVLEVHSEDASVIANESRCMFVYNPRVLTFMIILLMSKGNQKPLYTKRYVLLILFDTLI